MRIFVLKLKLLGILVLTAVASIAIAKTQSPIIIQNLSGKIYFIGHTEHTPGVKSARQLHVVNANGSDSRPLLPEMSSVWYLTAYQKLNKLTFNHNSSDPSKNGLFSLDIKKPWKPEELESRLGRPLPDDFPAGFQNPAANGMYYTITFSPDGSLVTAVRRNQLQIADVKTGSVSKVEGQLAKGSFTSAWSPDGSKIAFIGCMFSDSQCNETELFIVDKDGKNLHQITNNPHTYSWWTLLFTSNARKPKYKEHHNVNSPSWSPDGKWIVYGSFLDIFKVRPDGSDVTLITKDAGHPTWSPDGSMIAYAAIRSDVPPLTQEEAGERAGYQPQNIYVSWADGTGETRITNNRTMFTYHELKWME